MLLAGLKPSYIRTLELLSFTNWPNSISLPRSFFIVCEIKNDRGGLQKTEPKI